MFSYRVLALFAIAAGSLGAVEPSKLCAFLPPDHGLAIPYGDGPARGRGLGVITFPIAPCAQPYRCIAGMGQFRKAIRPNDGSGALRAEIQLYKSPDDAQKALSLFDQQPNSRDYGDLAVVVAGSSPVRSQVRFALGPYLVEVYGELGPASRVTQLARQIEKALKLAPPNATCEAGNAPVKVEPMPSPRTNQPAAPATMSRAATAETGKAAACFPSDASAALLDPERHRGMAVGAPPEAITNLLRTRIRTIAGCARVSPDQWSSLYATVSVAIAKRSRPGRCFTAGSPELNQDWNFHKSQRPPRNTAEGLIYATEQAMLCLAAEEQPAFFAEVSSAIAATLEK